MSEPTILNLNEYILNTFYAVARPHSEIAYKLAQIWSDPELRKDYKELVYNAYVVFQNISVKSPAERTRSAEILFNAARDLKLKPTDDRRIYLLEAARRLDAFYILNQYENFKVAG